MTQKFQGQNLRNQPKYKFFKHWSYILRGLKEIFKNESSLRLEIYIFSLAFILLFFWKFGSVLSIFLIFSMALVLVCECINSAADLASPDIHLLAGAARDARFVWEYESMRFGINFERA